MPKSTTPAPPTQELTDRQEAVLDFIYTYMEKQGWPPTLREIGSYLGIGSTNGVNDHLVALEKKGYLERVPGKSRAIRVSGSTPLRGRGGAPGGTGGGGGAVSVRRVGTTRDTLEVPILGKIAAGAPILAAENIEDTVHIDRFFIGQSSEVFALRVSGESMIEAGIHDADFIFVKKRASAQPGDIVVALIDDEATVKRFFPEKNRIRFQPENRNMAPIYVDRGDFKQTMILGVVVGIYRKM
ncbi:MAG TPA: transcriptional repressor LexA [Myxococcota bacterium]|jgi:repressor LexA|nr:transcriptional repressor LexA [Myxococcota bacterium]